MKKIFAVLLITLCAILPVKAEVSFAYELGAEAVSAYLWRGMYNGGLSFQPTASVGYEGEHTSFSIGAWGSVGASDWKFRKENAEDPSQTYTYFVPELDIIGSFSFYGISVGFTHYYYCDGTNFLNWKDAETAMEGSSQTEVQAGINFGDELDIPLYFNWYTMVAGADAYEAEDGTLNRAWSSYIEIGYKQTWENIGLSLEGQIGITPWRSFYTNYEGKAAVNCLSLRLEKEWEVGDVCTMSVFAQGMLNTYGINSQNVFIKGCGDDKMSGQQKLNGTIGASIWF